MIASWPIIERGVDPSLKIADELCHLGTTVSGDCDDFGRFLGHTFWGTSESKLGVAFDWVEAVDGVFAMLDPMSVVSNIGFVDDTGASIPEFMTAVQLNRITHAIPWQAEVARVTSAARAASPWAERVKLGTDQVRRRETSVYGRPSFDDTESAELMGAMR